MNNLEINKECGFLKLNDRQLNEVFCFSDGYISFLNKCKTERETNKYIIEKLEKEGFVNIENIDKIENNTKIYYNNRNKSVYAIKLDGDITNGLNIIGSHIDSPRLDLKPNPLYEDSNLTLLKTHYYGGIKKYQWTAIPLVLKGVVIKNNKVININIGEDENDPIFTITDLLPHLAIKQSSEKLNDAIKGENLNIIVGSIPNDISIKNNILTILNEKYGIDEDDLSSSELELVPDFKAKTLGFDKSMIASYGQDDKSCTYSNLMSFIESSNSKVVKTAIFSDKEEIGSVGNTGMDSNNFDNFLNEVLNKLEINKPSLLTNIYCKSIMLSADVGAGIDPNYQDVSERNNASIIGFGVEINKYTGSKGKTGASDASAEYISFVKDIFKKNKIKYQVSELGKVDVGGGGTIAYILANKGVDVIDCGVPVISMHSPYEVTSKYDIYSSFQAYKSFYEEIEKPCYN